MPEISRFYGIIIQMFFKDHNPPHFHITYGEYRAVMTIENGIVEGNMTSKALKLVFEWMELHQDELMKNWELAQKGELPKAIEPLK
ncbi:MULTISPECIES: DUF4160 domain-containing protein [Chryseobacterium]|uniref:DUF4160 domain-containing protein n=1 Tax=Chryseobacterium sp. R2A-55 TaxID=2744445 RepID=UPI001F1F80BE|nr:DUF4160 domain-containing protein [Chryseobacterium sp. R2A-55]